MRQLPGGDALGPVFDSARHRLFHLETRDDYLAQKEAAASTRWKIDDYR
jgi:alpha-D-ribose 1-methylphosphonate 5-triphosphate synthase subunit PhnI